MNLLHKIKQGKELNKYAAEGSMENNLKQLITEDAYSQISEKFPKLVPLIVGINILEIIDNNTAIGAAVISVGESRLLIPIVYSGGIVDATTFLYNEDTDTMLALTKKVVKFMLASAEKSLAGEPFIEGNNESSRLDTGDINKLFVPPKTYNPKIASNGILFAVLESSPSVRNAMLNKLADSDTKNEFESIYGKDSVKHIQAMQDNSQSRMPDTTSPEVLFSLSKVASTDWKKKDRAIKEFSENGFVISHGADAQPKSLEKIATIETRLKRITGNEALEGIGFNTPGVYRVFSNINLRPLEVVVASTIDGRDTSILGGSIYERRSEDGNPMIGQKIDISKSEKLRPFKLFLSSGDESSGFLAFLNGNDISYISIRKDNLSVSRGLKSYTLIIPSGHPITTVHIEKDSSAVPVILGSSIYIGENNVRYIPRVIEQRKVVPIKFRDLDAKIGDDKDIVKVAFDGADFIYKHNAFSQHSLVNRLLDDGFDKNSIYGLVKTAKENGSVELMATNAKLDVLASMITNLAGKIEMQQQKLDEIAGAGLGGVTPEDIAQASQIDGSASDIPQGGTDITPEEQAMIASQQGGGTMMPDNASGIPSPEQDAYAQQNQADTIAQDQQLLGQDMPPQQDAQQGLSDGMNPQLSPQILQQLASIKDSNVMDVGILSALSVDTSEMAGLVKDYNDNILQGASALGRILFNFEIRKNDLLVSLGDKKYNQMTKTFKSLFVKMSDIYVDIVLLGFEDDGKMAS